MTKWFLITSAVLTVLGTTGLAARVEADDHTLSGSVVVKLRDACDPPTFNAVLGPNACVGEFRTTFEQFITELRQDQVVGAWRFHPLAFDAQKKTQLTISNLGGELHTFTEVKKFGGGFVPVLNELSGNPTPAPECAQVVNGQLVSQPASPTNLFVPAGQTVNGPTIAKEKERKFQCCIHPWMRTTVNADEE